MSKLAADYFGFILDLRKQARGNALSPVGLADPKNLDFNDERYVDPCTPPTM
ncbi:hypothetical protein V8V70_21830 [Mesobacillus zeae]|nr:hypothetical protein [Mesobacillus zeae]